MTYKTCTTSDGCTEETGHVVLDANWRYVHGIKSYTNCYEGTTWDSKFCPDDKTCAQSCALEGVDAAGYNKTYGVETKGNALKLGYVIPGGNVGSRTYLLDKDNHYLQFGLKNKEFTFTVDTSNLPCGVNGALYFSEMAADGGLSAFPDNKAGANYGTGYCDAQCPHDVKFINGESNSDGWDSKTG
jgi:cellulose 1,4-beta-cellobiosidase